MLAKSTCGKQYVAACLAEVAGQVRAYDPHAATVEGSAGTSSAAPALAALEPVCIGDLLMAPDAELAHRLWAAGGKAAIRRAESGCSAAR